MMALCLAIALHDVDGPIVCKDGTRIRLAGIGARELDGSCRGRQPCPKGDPFKARRTVAAAMGATIKREDRSRNGHAWFTRPVRLTYEATGISYGRVTARVRLPSGRDLSCEAIRLKVAGRWRAYDRGGRLLGCGR